jgi:putative ABC transport system permease protein
MRTLLADVRFALRGLAQRPGFAAVALATLAVGIGANAAVYSVAQAVLLRPLPFREPDRLVMVWERNVSRSRPRNVVNPGNYLAWRERNTVFEEIAAMGSGSRNVTGDGAPVRLDVGGVTTNFFATLGVGPALGRGFVEADGQPGAPDVVILSDGLWRSRFAADPRVLGRSLMLNDRPATVVGVMPAGFALPPGSELWLPLVIGEGGLQRDSRGRSLMTVARLRDGVSVAQAQGALDGIARQLVAERPEFNTGWDAFVAPLHADLVRDVRPAVLVLMGAVGLVLLIGCGNLATLLLARALAREREIAIRRALGAGTGRLVAQLLTESLVLSLAGGALGLLLAAWLTRALMALVPPEVDALFRPTLDPKVAAFALVLSVASAVLFGLVPAWQTVRPQLARSLREGTAGSGLSGSRRRLARLVVAGEVALALLLLLGAGVLLRSFARLSTVDAGFDPQRVLSLQVSLSGDRYADDAAGRFYADALERIGALPGVESAAAISWRPYGIGSATRFALPDREAPPAGQEPTGEVRIVSPGLFRTLGIPLREGRDFDARDAAGRPQAVIVNEHVARAFWPGQSAIGRRIAMQWGGPLDAEIVGVVADARLVGLDTPARATLYWPVSQVRNPFMTLLVKSSGRPEAVAGSVRQAIASLDPELPVAKVAPLSDVMADSIARPRFVFLVIGAFAATAVLLAALGLFGVLSYSVGQRLPEMGVRLALGARPRDVAALVLREGVVVSTAGALVGLLGALVLARFLEGLLFETSPRDPFAWAAVTILVPLVALAASWLPARRAARVDPSAVLRSE